MPAANYHGKSGVVYMSTTGSGTAVVVRLSKWSLNRATDKAETTSFGDGNKTYVQGLPDLKVSLSGFWDSGDDSFFTGAESTDGVKMYLYPSANAPSKYFYGTAWFDSSIDVPVSGPVAISGDGVAKGTWGRM